MLVSVTEGTMTKPGDLVQGTLDLLILRVVALEPVHGWAIARRIRQISGGVWQVGQSALHPALHKLEQQGCITAGWKISENNRRAKYDSLTRAGRKALTDEAANWERLSTAISALVRAVEGRPKVSRWLTQICLAVRSVFHRRQTDQDLDEEFQYHLDPQIDEELKRGVAPEPCRIACDGHDHPKQGGMPRYASPYLYLYR